MKSRLFLAAAALAVAVFAVASAGRAAEAPAKKPLEGLEQLFVLFDANQNKVLDPPERALLEQHLAVLLGEQRAPLVLAALAATDADRDGRITEAEWRRLASLGLRSQEHCQTVMLPMSDGVRLATDVYRPDGDGPLPVVLMRTPYGRKSTGAQLFLVAGCAVVSQDMRGRFESEGENLPFIGCGWAPHQDGVDTLRWIRRQPWCNGKVGTMGGSAGGITQYLLAGAAPEGLTAQCAIVAAPSMYHYAAYVGGALRKEQIENWIRGNRFDPQAVAMYAEHPTYDDFWKQFDTIARQAVINVPALHIGGWFDTFGQGTIDAFTSRQHHGAAGARGTQRLLMGPWTHGVGNSKVGDLKFRDAGGLPPPFSPEQWVDWALKGVENDLAKAPAVCYYVMGDTTDPAAPGNQWRRAPDWPIPCRETPYYFTREGGLATAPPPTASGEPACREYTFDPADPCPTVGGANLTIAAGPMNQNPVEGRADVLTFTTEPLARPVEVTGRITARVVVSSSARDTDLSVRFCDVYPGGKSYLMAEGMLRLRYRGGFEKTEALTPGQAYEVAVDCWSTSIIINTGHRIRATVTSSNHPRFDLNPGTGRPWSGGADAVKQTNRIYCDGRRPSRILLPVIAGPAAAAAN